MQSAIISTANAPVAQWIEHRIPVPRVGGSSPFWRAKKHRSAGAVLFGTPEEDSKNCNRLPMQQRTPRFSGRSKQAASGDVCERRQWRKKRAIRRGSGRNSVSVSEQRISGTATGTLAVAPPLRSAESLLVAAGGSDNRLSQSTKTDANPAPSPVSRRRGAHRAPAAGTFDFAANHILRALRREDSFSHGLRPCQLPQGGSQGRCVGRGGGTPPYALSSASKNRFTSLPSVPWWPRRGRWRGR